jgi:hypothetical protein
MDILGDQQHRSAARLPREQPPHGASGLEFLVVAQPGRAAELAGKRERRGQVGLERDPVDHRRHRRAHRELVLAVEAVAQLGRRRHHGPALASPEPLQGAGRPWSVLRPPPPLMASDSSAESTFAPSRGPSVGRAYRSATSNR